MASANFSFDKENMTIHAVVNVGEDEVGHNLWYMCDNGWGDTFTEVFCPGTHSFSFSAPPGSTDVTDSGIESSDRRGTNIKLIGPWGTREVFVYRGAEIDGRVECGTFVDDIELTWDVSSYYLCDTEPVFPGVYIWTYGCSPVKILLQGPYLGEDTEYYFPFSQSFEDIFLYYGDGNNPGVYSGDGSVSISPNPSSFCDEQKGYTTGSLVTLTATPATGWEFDHWELYTRGTSHTSDEGYQHYEDGSTSAQITITARDFAVSVIRDGYRCSAICSTSVRAYFVISKKLVTVSCDPISAGSADFCDGSDAKYVDYGTSLAPCAHPDDCHWLDHWLVNGSVVRKAHPWTTIDRDTVFIAVFTKKIFKTTGDRPVFDYNTGYPMFGCGGMPIFGTASVDWSKAPELPY